MSEIDWSSNAVRVLMAQYERRPELWDRQHSLYRATTTKYKAWMSLAKIFSCDVTELRKKFNSLLASYRRERSKVKEGGRSGWFLYPHMAFLPGYLPNPLPDAPQHPYQKEEEAAAEEPYESPDEAPGEAPATMYRYETDSEREQDARARAASEEREDPLVKPEPEPQPQPRAGAVYNYKNYQIGRNKKRLTRTLKRGRERPKEVTKAYVESRLRDVEAALRHGGAGGAGGGVRRDDCDTYGEYIAATLRKHDNKTQCLIKQAINSILFEQEMSQYSNPLDAEMVTELLDASEDE